MSVAENNCRIDYVEFGVTDMAQTKAFYGAVFGWALTDWGPDYCSFEDGRLNGGFTTESKPGSGGALVIIYASELEQIEQKVKTAGGAIVKEIFSFPGGRRFHFTDPSGNELAVWSDK